MLTDTQRANLAKLADVIELHCRACKRSVEFPRTSFPDVPAWVARLEHDKCNICDDGDFSAEHWIDADGREPDPLEIEILVKATDPRTPADGGGNTQGRRAEEMGAWFLETDFEQPDEVTPADGGGK